MPDILFESIEGLPGTGKTTIAPLLAAARQGVLVPTVPAHYQPLRRELDHSDNPDARMCLFLSGLFTATDQIRRYLDAGIPVVVESYFARCLAWHKVFGARLEVVLPGTVPEPMAYQLICAENERARRIMQRDKPPTRWDDLGEQRVEQLAEAYRRFPMHQIDTTTSTPDEVVLEILSRKLIEADHADC